MKKSGSKTSRIFLHLLLVFFLVTTLFQSGHAENTGTKELSLKKCMELAVLHSPALMAEKRNQEAAALNSKNVEWDWVPDLILGANYKYEEGGQDNNGDIRPFLTLSQVVFNNPQSYTKKVEALNRTVSVHTARIKILSELYTNIIEKYFTLVQAQNSFQLLEEYLQKLEQDFEQSRSRARKGLISELELMQNESLLEMTRIEADLEKNKVQNASFELASLLNLDVDQTLIATDIFQPHFYEFEFAQARAYAKKHHPMFKLNRKITEKIPEFKRMIDLINWPSLTVSGSIGRGADDLESDSDYNVSVTLSKSLWDFGKTGRRQQMLAIELENRENDIRQSEKLYFIQLKKLYLELRNSRKLLKKMMNLRSLTDRLNTSAEKNYKMGLISYQDLLQAKKREMEKRAEYLAVSSRYLISEMLFKLNCGVFDPALLLNNGPAWLEEEYSLPEILQ